MLQLLFAIALSLCTVSAMAVDWDDYPDDLPQFDFSGDALKAQWDTLTAMTHVEYPDEAWLKKMLETHPRLAHAMLVLATEKNPPPAVFMAIHDSNYAPLAAELQTVWRLHYSGRYKEAYELGMSLGPFGEIPAVYSLLVHTTLLEHDADDKMRDFQRAEAQANVGLTLAPDYTFALFGRVYSRVRMLELMSTGEARSSGLISQAKDTLTELAEAHPNEAAYPLTRGGLQAGIVERVGSFLGSLTYGATESNALEDFQKAIALSPDLPMVYNEFVIGLTRLDAKDHRKDIRNLLQLCLTLTPFSAEEALNQQQCRNRLKEL